MARIFDLSISAIDRDEILARTPEGGRRRLILHCPEITLKGQNARDFRAALADNVRLRLRAIGCRWPVKVARGRVYVDPPAKMPISMSQVIEALTQVAGIETLAVTTWLRPNRVGLTAELDRALIEKHMIAIARRAYRPGASFAVRVNRMDKRVAMHSKEMEIWLGNAIRAHSDWRTVNLKHPDTRFQIDIYPDGMYIYPGKFKAGGGLPVGTGGQVLSLLSGGIDSPVASYLMARRGCTIDFFHLAASHLPFDNIALSNVARLAKTLSCFTLRSKLYVAPYTHFDLALMASQTRYGLILFRRFMTRAAARLAGDIGALALVCGDSLGQVASQTLENLLCQTQGENKLILRPLIGFNKQEIIAIAREINTYEISIEPYKDCCALLSMNPKTRAKIERVLHLESALFADYDALITATLADIRVLRYECGELVGDEQIRRSYAARAAHKYMP